MQIARVSLNKLRHDKLLHRFAEFNFGLAVIGYAAVLVLTTQGIAGPFWANFLVSKTMAPAGLFADTKAITGRFRPTFAQVAKWVTYWLPSAAMGGLYLAFLVATFDLGSNGLKARAVVGLTLFPISYIVKKFIIFTKQTWDSRYLDVRVDQVKRETQHRMVRASMV